MQNVICSKSASAVVVVDQQEGPQVVAYVRPEVITMSNVGEVIRGGGGYYPDGINLGKTDRT